MRTTLSILFLGATLAAGLSAQNADLAAEIAGLRRDVDLALAQGLRLEEERSALIEARIRNPRELDALLETMVADLGREGSDVLSQADPIRIFGDFRVRLGFDQGRNFGNPDNGIAPLLFALVGDPGEADDDPGHAFMLARFLLGFDFHFDRRVMTRFSMQALGQFNNGLPPAPSARVAAAAAGGGAGVPVALREAVNGPGAFYLTDIHIYEAFIQVEDVFEISGLDVRTGRQEIVFGNEFIFGNNEFFGGETFDALRVTLDLGDVQIDGLALKMAAAETSNGIDHPTPAFGSDNGFDDDELFGLYLSWRPGSKLEVDGYWLYWHGKKGGSSGTLGNAIPSLSTGDALTETGFLRGFFHTLGLRLSGDLGDLDFNLEFAWQTGSLDDFLDREVAGVAAEIDLGWTVDRDSRARLYVRGLYSEGAHRDESGFIPLFPERHSYRDPTKPRSGARYGLMDIIPMDNVFSAQIGFAFDPTTAWTVGAALLWATHDADLRPFAAKEDDIGFEIDLFADYRYSAETTLGFGFGIFLPDEGAPYVGGGFIGPDGRDEPTFLAYLDLRVLF